MIALALIIHTILILAMMVAVICFESDCKKIIFWNIIIVLTSVFGFIVYFIYFCDKPKIKKTIKNKFEQDDIYKNLIGFSMNKINSNNEFINFNKRHYNAEIFKNNNIEVIDNIEMFVNSVSAEIEKANSYIILENEVFLSGIRNDNIISLLKEKQSMGVDVRYIYGRCTQSDKATIKDLKNSGIKVCRFNKNDKFNKYYKNTKNILCIDGKVVYLYNSVKNISNSISYSSLFYRIQGEVIKSIDLDCHLDVSFATQKYYELELSSYDAVGELEMQYVSSVADKDFEGLFLKAINDAKKQIIIHLNKFVPTPAIKQALQMAIMSGIDVKIMLPKNNNAGNYYSSRAYLKEMALYGATGYFYDGFIYSNFIVIDHLTFVGNFSLVNLEIRNNLQNVLIINSVDFAEKSKNYFNEQINNSYRICKPKNILFREKIFKKFN